MDKSVLLQTMPALIFDCQATGMNPQRDLLLEVGWMVIGTIPEVIMKKPQAYLVKPKDNQEIPKRIEMITGITNQDLNRASCITEIGNRFCQILKQISDQGISDTLPFIIHYARFELAWLHELFKTYVPNSLPQPKVICTHEIAQRLFPDLPRRSLRAVAGYLSFSAEEMRRSAHHVEATAWIWEHMIPLLAHEHKIKSLSQLDEWLGQRRGSAKKGRSYPMEKKLLRDIPDKPGIYQMLRANGDLLYVGKSVSLKQRIRSYFRKKSGHAEHILEMLSQAKDIRYHVTGSGLEAALLESDLIKQFSPPYNKALKSNQRVLYYFTRDLGQSAKRWTSKFSIGPIPNDTLLTVFPILANIIRLSQIKSAYEPDFLNHALFGFNSTYVPDITCLKQGVAMFIEQHKEVLQSQNILAALKKIGTESWKQKLLAALEDDNDDDNNDDIYDNEKEEKEPFVWTPEAVTKTIERQLRYGMQLIRRARLFCLLCESSLAWSRKDSQGELGNLLIFHHGMIRDSSPIQRKKKIQNHSLPQPPGYIKRIRTNQTEFSLPLPPGYKKRFRTRQKQFTLPLYDRMRVLITELRRLLQEKRRIALRLNQRSVLNGEQLEKLLKWI